MVAGEAERRDRLPRRRARPFRKEDPHASTASTPPRTPHACPLSPPGLMAERACRGQPDADRSNDGAARCARSLEPPADPGQVAAPGPIGMRMTDLSGHAGLFLTAVG